MPTEEQKRHIEELIRVAKSNRSSQQGVLRGYVTKLQTLLDENDCANRKDVDELVIRMIDHRHTHEEYYSEAVRLMDLHGVSKEEIAEKHDSIIKDVDNIHDKARTWLMSVQDITFSSESDAFDTTVMENVEHSFRESMEADQQIEDLTTQLSQMKKKLNLLDDTQYEVSSLKNSLKQADDRREAEAAEFQNRLHDMQSQLIQQKEENDRLRAQRMSTSTPRLGEKPGYMPFDTTGRGNRTALEQEDFMAISQIVTHSNVEIVKQVLDRTMEQQKTFYQTIQTPRVELPKFSGDYTSYHSFINRFEDLVGKTDSTDSVKLNTLMQSCTASVLKHIECCNYKDSTEGYLLARKLLKNRYGNPFLISQAWVTKMTEYPKLTDPEDVLIFVSDLRSCRESLDTLGFLSDMENTANMREIVGKIPAYMQHRWRKHNHEQMSKGRKATLLELINIISNAAEEQADPVYGAASLGKMSTKPDKDSSMKKVPLKKKANVNVVSAEESAAKPSDAAKPKRRIQCSFCSEPHYPRLCPGFESKSPCDRLKMVKEKRLCILCLNPFHQVANCNLKWTCQEVDCNKRHNTTLHQAYAVLPDKTDESSTDDKKDGGGTVSFVSHDTNDAGFHAQDNEAYSLPLIPVHVEGQSSTASTHVLMDTGSTLTFITKRFCDKIGLQPYCDHRLTLTSMTDTRSFMTRLVNFNLKPTDNNKWVTAMRVAVVDELPAARKYVKRLQCLNKWPYLESLDIQPIDTDEVDILVGQNNAKFFAREVEVHGSRPDSPYAVRTPLGWMLMGHSVEIPQVDKDCEVNHSFVCIDEPSLDKKLEMMWQVDQVPDIKQEDPIDVKIKKLWEEQARVVDGHLEVPIPFKNIPPRMPNNKIAVEKRMESLKRRMQRDLVVKDKCFETMSSDFLKGYAEVPKEEADPDYRWYVPILPVITYTDKRPGKCRLVGDLGIVHQGRCLNDEVHQGPNYTASLYDMLIMFRKYQFAITGDLKEMFNQVRVPAAQRDCLRFLWWIKGLSEPAEECRMKTQMFGGTWCPAVCQYALQWVANHPQGEYDVEVIETVLRHFYVDDMLRSIWDEELGYSILMNVRVLLNEIGFEMCKLGSSSLAILEKIPAELRAKEYKEITFDLHDGVTSLALGSVYKPGKDIFTFKVVNVDKPVTKRGVLSVATSLFDPIGLIAPFVLRAKMLIQDLCKEGLSWDEPLPAIYNRTWTTWVEEIPLVENFTIPRWIGMSKVSGLQYNLHIFADASTKGYGAAVYLVVSNQVDEVLSSTLVTSKAKVAPIKPVTIPRLELSASVLGVKLERSVRENLGADLGDSCFWTDSTIVLWYIKGQSWKYKTFVSNRIAYIQERTTDDQWYYVPTELNVADHVSRGMSAKEIIDSKVWREGPLFLSVRADRPVQPDLSIKESEVELKKRTDAVCFYVKHDSDEDNAVRTTFLSRYSEWSDMIRHACIWHRVIKFLKTKIYKKGYFTVEERYQAELSVIRLIQEAELTLEQRSSKIFNKLFPFNKEGIYRVGGRLHLSSISDREKHPPILPSSEYTHVFIRHMHERGGHCGVDRTFHDVKKKIWLLGGKKTVKAAISSCVVCKKLKQRPGVQIMSPLPVFRIEQGSVPFDVVGIDYFGPLYVRVGRGTQKRYVCIITDMKIRAVHVEVVHDMTTAAFLMALQRFVSRRGRPSMIISDNGSNFIGAKRELKQAFKEFNQEKIGNELADQGIRWQCNTPLASHHGGAWERLIRSFRMIFLSIVGGQRLNDEGLLTFAASTERVLNSRPLTKVTEDSEDDDVLTPEHLLNLRPAQGLPGKFDSADTLRSRWKNVLNMADQFWKKWVAVYLQTLQVRQRWIKPTKNWKKNDIVLMRDDSVHRLHWPLGRIIDVFPGHDGRVRSVRVKTQKGEFERPITKLIPLECS